VFKKVLCTYGTKGCPDSVLSTHREVSLQHLVLNNSAERNLSFVPAESAEIGITDKILTKITTQDTVSKVM
jgi:hypothetical protein